MSQPFEKTLPPLSLDFLLGSQTESTPAPPVGSADQSLSHMASIFIFCFFRLCETSLINLLSLSIFLVLNFLAFDIGLLSRSQNGVLHYLCAVYGVPWTEYPRPRYLLIHKYGVL